MSSFLVKNDMRLYGSSLEYPNLFIKNYGRVFQHYLHVINTVYKQLQYMLDYKKVYSRPSSTLMHTRSIIASFSSFSG